MNARCLIAVCCLLAVAACAQVVPPPSQNQQIESGVVRVPAASSSDSIQILRYSIRLLPVSSFPQLPSQVAAWLTNKGCMIPQTYLAHGPDNVISGSFEKAGSSDWAVLCSVKGTSTLYVFFGSNLSKPIDLRSQPDNLWLGIDPAWMSDYGSAWGIATRPSVVMPRQDNLDHDGIDDTNLNQSTTTTHYYNDGHWTVYDFEGP